MQAEISEDMTKGNLKPGDEVSTPYGIGIVVHKRGETYVEFEDGSGRSLHEVIQETETESE